MCNCIFLGTTNGNAPNWWHNFCRPIKRDACDQSRELELISACLLPSFCSASGSSFITHTHTHHYPNSSWVSVSGSFPVHCCNLSMASLKNLITSQTHTSVQIRRTLRLAGVHTLSSASETLLHPSVCYLYICLTAFDQLYFEYSCGILINTSNRVKQFLPNKAEFPSSGPSISWPSASHHRDPWPLLLKSSVWSTSAPLMNTHLNTTQREITFITKI